MTIFLIFFSRTRAVAHRKRQIRMKLLERKKLLPYWSSGQLSRVKLFYIYCRANDAPFLEEGRMEAEREVYELEENDPVL